MLGYDMPVSARERALVAQFEPFVRLDDFAPSVSGLGPFAILVFDLLQMLV
jgi:hypothetical protein